MPKMTEKEPLARHDKHDRQIASIRELVLQEMRMVAEGVKTTESAHYLAAKLGIDMPITEKVYSILYADKPPREAVVELMTRDLKAEEA